MKTFNKNILWCQSENSAEDIMLIDGTFVDNQLQRQQAFSYMSVALAPDIDGKKHVWKKIKLRQNLSILAQSLSIYEDNFGNILVKSHYKEVDDVGRKIVFSYCCSLNNKKNIKYDLIESSKIINRHCEDVELEIIQSVGNRVSHKKIYVLLIILIMLFFVIYIICQQI